MNTEIHKDKNGNYWLGDNRLLVSYMRGDHRPVRNPVRSKFQPEYLVEYFPGPVGVVISFVFDGVLRFGFSKANLWRGDHFDRKLGLQVAVERAMLRNIQPPFEDATVQPDIYDALHRMYGRAKNYFKHSIQLPPSH